MSPQIGADKRVTFRLRAPGAQRVTITGDFLTNNTPMTRDETGVWSFTGPTMAPGVYGYYFSLDGVRIPDPGNLFTFSGGMYLKSYYVVDGDGGEFWAVRDVPHGQVHEVYYTSPGLPGTRRFLVYTPPGYSAGASRTYPTVYLYSGSGDNETYWTRIGRANFIMDNLIADGNAAPALLVMPYGHTSLPAPPESQEDGVNGVYSVRAIERDLVETIVPLVEKTFRAGKSAKDRAIFGFSMGGYLAPTIGLNNPKLFGFVAGSSGGFRVGMDMAGNFKGLVSDRETSRRNLKFVGLMVGTGQTDAGSAAQNMAAVDYLRSLGITVEWDRPQDGTHTWHSWRGYFRDLMERKFFVEKPYVTPAVGTRTKTSEVFPTKNVSGDAPGVFLHFS